MNIKQFRYFSDNLGYLLYSGKTGVAIDGGAVADMLAFAADHGVSIQYVTNTHSHPDHTAGNQELLDRTRGRYLDFQFLIRAKKIDLGGGVVEIFHTPGHTRDSVCFYADRYLVSGDTLFNGKVGKCFSGDTGGFFRSVQSLLALPDDTVVYAGHDYVEEYMDFARSLEPDNPHIDPYLQHYDPADVCATLGEEKKVNPFLRLNDEKIVSILQKRGLAARTEMERFQSLLSIM